MFEKGRGKKKEERSKRKEEVLNPIF